MPVLQGEHMSARARTPQTAAGRALTLPVLRLIRLLDRLKARSIPVCACDPVHELLVFRAHTRHCGFEQVCIPLYARAVFACLDGVQEGVLQVAGEVPLDLL